MTASNELDIATETLSILRRVAGRPIEPTLESEVAADLGFDSVQVLELVAELEDHFDISVPLNALPRVRTVGQMVREVERLVAGRAVA